MKTRLRLVVLGVAAATASAAAIAQPSRPQGLVAIVGGGLEHTDNAYRSEGRYPGCDEAPGGLPDCVPEQSDTKSFVSLDLGWYRASEALESDVMYRSEVAHYDNDTTRDNTVIEGHGEVTWRALPDRIHLVGRHDRSEQIQDTRNPDIRNNNQLRDILSVGPDFIARMSPVDDLILTGRLTQVRYDDAEREDIPQTRNGDSERAMGGLTWAHRLSPTDTLSANYRYEDTEFDDAASDFSFEQLYGTYAVELRTSGYSLSLGANRSERSDGTDSDGFYAQATGFFEVGSHRLDLTAVNQLTDSSIGLGGTDLVDQDYRPEDGNFNVVDVVERTSLRVGWRYTGLCERCTLALDASYDEQDFETEPRDQEAAGVGGSLGYRLTPTMTASIRARASTTEYPQDAQGSGRTDDITEYGATLDWRLSRSLSARFWLTSNERESDAGGQGYEELFGGASVSYALR